MVENFSKEEIKIFLDYLEVDKDRCESKTKERIYRKLKLILLEIP